MTDNLSPQMRDTILGWVWKKKFRTHIGRTSLISLDEFRDFLNSLVSEDEIEHTFSMQCKCRGCIEADRRG